MFEYVRTHQRLMQFILLLFIVPSFALVGVSSYMRTGGDSTVAKVAGESISQQEFDDAMRDHLSQLRQRYGAQFDEALFNTPEEKQKVLDNLIGQRALRAEIVKAGLTVSDADLQKSILSIPGLTLADGAFDKQGYIRALAGQGLTQTGYENGLRRDMAQQQLVNAVQGSAFASKTLAAQVNTITAQQRDVQRIDFKDADFIAQVKVTDAMLKAYYDKNNTEFAVPETAKIAYVVLSGEALASQMPVTDTEIKDYYNQNLKNYSIAEQRRASHILIKVSKTATPAERAAAKAKAEEVLAMVRKQPDNFAALAKKYSQDEGSTAQGGDLDYFGRGMMLKPFEDAAYQLKQDQISDLVETDFGYHIIRLTSIKPASVKPLDEVSAQISADIKKQKADKKFGEFAETFTNTVYEQPDSLKPVADKLKLTVQTADNLSRTASQDNVGNLANMVNPVLSNPKFLKALFADDVIKNKHNMEALDLGSNTLVSAHIVDYKPASKRPFDEVRALVLAKVTAQQAEVLAQAAGTARLAALTAKADDVGFGAAQLVSRLQQSTLPRAAVDLILKADVRKLPAFVGLSTPGQGYVVYRINKIEQAPVDAARAVEISKQIDTVTSQQSLYLFMQQLKQEGDVKIVKPIVAVKSAG